LRGQVAHHDPIVGCFTLQRRQQRLALRLDQLELAAPFAADVGDRLGAGVENTIS